MARAGFRLTGAHAPGLAAFWAERLFLTARRHARPEWEKSALEGAAFRRVRCGDAFVPTWTWGDRDRPAVLLVHGWEGRGSQLATFVPSLLAAGLRVVCFDAPGHGDAPSRTASVVEHARGVVAVDAKLGPFHAVIGHSVGGAAILLATRFGFAADRYVLVSPPVGPKRAADGFVRVLGLTPAVRDEAFARLERRYGMTIAELDARQDASRLDSPLLVVHDGDDRVVPFVDGASIAGAARQAEIFETTGLGHRRILRDPEVVDAVTRFAVTAAPATPSFVETLEGELYHRDRRQSLVADRATRN